MSIRVKALLVLIAIIVFIAATNFFSGLYFTKSALRKTLERDLEFAIGIADSLLSTRMNQIKAEAIAVAERLKPAESNVEIRRLMREELRALPHLSSLTLFDRNGVLLVNHSAPPHPPHDHGVNISPKYLAMVYDGATMISSPFYCAVQKENVINVCTPMDGGRMLAVSIPGQTFTEILSQYRLWESGSIFMLNEEGNLIGAASSEIDLALKGYSTERREDLTASIGEEFRAIDQVLHRILSTDSGVTGYQFEGVEHLCAYNRIEGSPIGWRVVVGIPLNEGPLAGAMTGQSYAALLFLLIGVGAALLLSARAAGPFMRIEAQNRDLATLNATVQAQNEKIQHERDRAMLMLDSTPLAARLWDREYRLVDCNEEAVRLFGLRDKQEYFQRYFEFSPPCQPDGCKTVEKIKRMVDEAFETGACTYDWLYRLADGTPIPAEVRMVRVPHDDDYVVASYSRDLRAQRKMLAEIEDASARLKAALDDAKNANEAKSSFLAHMSHEIRTPLNAVIGLSELTLEDTSLSPETASNVEKVCGAGSTILSIVNDILDISKIESGKFETYPARYETPSLVNDIVTLNIVRIGEKPIDFRLVVDENLPSELYGDDLRIKRIFSNLLSNAFKYTHAGSVEWRISFEKEGDSIWLVSSVRDTGIGIREEDLPRLFADYNQVDMGANRKIGGTGLGLAITKRLAEMMDGGISVESEYGKGSTFSVRLRQTAVSCEPIGRVAAENLMRLRYSDSKRNRNAQLVRAKLPDACVLVVDDVVTNLDVVRGMMKPYGMKIDCATGGRQAVEMIRAEKRRYNAVFMDHMMPEVDGMEATRIIRDEIGTEYARTIPIIALTANAIVGTEEMFLSKGFQDFISKPIDMAKLDAVLRRWVRNGARGDAPPE